MPTSTESNPVSRYLVSAAAMVIIIAGLGAAQTIVVPFLVALFLAIIFAPLLAWLQQKGVPSVMALLTVLASLVLLAFLVVLLVGSSLTQFTQQIPDYQTELQAELDEIKVWLVKLGIDLSDPALAEEFSPQRAMELVTGLVNGVGSIISNGVLILLTVVFLLLETSSFSAKLVAMYGGSQSSLAIVQKITQDVRQYMVLKTAISFATGFMVGVMLMIFGVQFPWLWALLAFLLNYVPNIGSYIAAAPAVLLAVLDLGFGPAIGVAIGYAIINVAVGNFIEPRIMGRGLGLSTLVVFVSLVFWGWLLGPIGMILSVPLTMTVKIAMENIEETKRFAILLDSEAEYFDTPAEAADDPVDTPPAPDDETGKEAPDTGS